MNYINNDNTLGIFTVQFQQIDHPKVHSIPLGLDHTFPSNSTFKFMNRTQQLMINSGRSTRRISQLETVIRNFNGTIQNTYHFKDETNRTEQYIAELLRSKFIMSPSGIGWDCYRNWEALRLGAIPVIEHYNRTDGWHRTFDGLPVVWVTTFDELTPTLLDSEYTRLSMLRNFTWEKLTMEYWVDFIYSQL